jgi:hypothetical protein
MFSHLWNTLFSVKSIENVETRKLDLEHSEHWKVHKVCSMFSHLWNTHFSVKSIENVETRKLFYQNDNNKNFTSVLIFKILRLLQVPVSKLTVVSRLQSYV